MCGTNNAQNLTDEKKIRTPLNKFFFVEAVNCYLEDAYCKTVSTKVIPKNPI